MYDWREHTAELELVVEAPSLADVFVEAMRAFAELVEQDAGGEAVRHEVGFGAADAPSALVQWLDELVFLAETDEFVPERVVELDAEPARFRAVVEGRRDRPAPLVKAATYHGLALGERDGVWHARVVLDV
jgi:SHS2 domain-containing protein